MALGTVEFGSHLEADRCAALLDRYLERGGRLIDTAPTYGRDTTGRCRSELVLGAWLSRTGANCAVATKAGLDPATGEPDLNPGRIIRSAHRSLDTLTSIDLLLLHRDDPTVGVDEVADALTRLIKDGTTTCIGVSNWQPARLALIVARLTAGSGSGLHATAPLWSLARRSPRPTDPELIEVTAAHLELARRHLLQVLPFRTAALGYFAHPVSRRHADYRGTTYDTPANQHRRRRAGQLADRHGRSRHQIALAWLCSADLPVTPVVGATSIAQLDEAMTGCTTVLSTAQHAYLTGGSPV